MKVSLIALIACCAVTSSAFAFPADRTSQSRLPLLTDLPESHPPQAQIADLPESHPPQVQIADLPESHPPQAQIADLPESHPPQVQIADLPESQPPQFLATQRFDI